MTKLLLLLFFLLFVQGEKNLRNLKWAIAAADFPNVFPIEKPRIQVKLWITATKYVFLRGYVDAIFKNDDKKTKKSLAPKSLD